MKKLLIISFDIATEKMYLVVEKDGELIALNHEYSTPEKYNSAVLIPVLQKIFKDSNLNPSDIDLIAINNGPGSFTGIRAGAVVARTLGQFLNVPVVPVSSLEIYANACKSDKNKYVILDARRSKWYTGYYSCDNSEIQEPELKLNTEVMDFIRSIEAQIITEPCLVEQLKDYNPVLITELDEDAGMVLTKIAKNKIANAEDFKNDFAWYKLKPTYLQTPSITMPKKVQIVKPN